MTLEAKLPTRTLYMRGHQYTPEHLDLVFMSLSEQAAKDYNDMLKVLVLPVLAARYKINIRDLRVLMCLQYFAADVSASVIADTLRQDRATVTRSVIVLVGEGLVETRENMEDARSKILHLTDEGERACELISQTIANSLGNIKDSFAISFDPEQLRGLIEPATVIRDRAERFLRAAKISLKLSAD